MIDITEQKEKESELMELTTRLQLATKSAQLGIFDLDLINTKLFWDDASYKIFGINPDDNLDVYETSVNSIHPEDREGVKYYLFSKIEKGNDFFNIFRIQLPNGEIRFIESNGILLRNSNGKAYRLTGVNRDITDLKKMQDVLKDTNVMLEDKVKIRTNDLQNAYNQINDSINYAQNIQLALLNKNEDCQRIFPNSFVCWSPKDVVSGDFFWCHSDDKYNYIAAVDCTGHGVPGAFLSIVAKHTLDNIVITNKIIDPKDILFQLDNAIVSSLHQQSKLVKDGMDIVFCRIEKETSEIVFSGALRPLFYFDGNKIQEIQGDSLGIGGFWGENRNKKFEQKIIQGKPGDTLYLSSDGYYSQFGGEKGKKLMKKNFCKNLLSVSNKPIKEQKDLLEYYFSEWQGEEEQVDDVLIVGIQL